MSLLNRLNPKEGITDFWSEFRRPNPYRWPILAVSILITSSLMLFFTKDSAVGPPVPYEVEYITTFRDGRSPEEIRQENLANQRRKDELERILAEREERKKELYRALGRAAGMDVEKIEREAAEDAARVEDEAARERERLSDQYSVDGRQIGTAQTGGAQTGEAQTDGTQSDTTR
ncbi:MAG: hypothetical protein WA908_00475 [Pontixanthobacter sp.]